MVDLAKKSTKSIFALSEKNRNFAANKTACFLLYARPALSQLIVCLSTSRTARIKSANPKIRQNQNERFKIRQKSGVITIPSGY